VKFSVCSSQARQVQQRYKQKKSGGGREIRTPGTVSRTVVFKTTRFNHSRIPPSNSLQVLGKNVPAFLPHRRPMSIRFRQADKKSSEIRIQSFLSFRTFQLTRGNR
jgi:hypothetical protein